MPVARSAPAWNLTLRPTALLLGVALVALNLTALLGAKAAVLFLLACVWLILRRPGDLLAETRAAWLLWLLALWCLLSTFWSGAPGATLRYAIQLVLTFAIGIAAASRLSVSSLLRVLIVSSLLIAFASVGLGRANTAGHWMGVFNSKNALAQFSSLGVIVAAAMLMAPRRHGGWIPAAVALLLLALLLLVRADSTGALIATAIAVLAMLGLRTMPLFSGWQKIVLGLAMVLVTLFGLVLVSGYFDEISRLFLRLTGKDVTLTGRTTLWREAFDQIARHPLLGQGFKGFWVPGNPVAERLWAEFGIASKTGFHFHNTLISNTVEIGLIGVALQVAIFFPALVITLRWAIARPDAESLFLAGLMLRQLALMNSELVFFTQFEPMSVLTVMAVTYARRIRLQTRRDSGRARDQAALRSPGPAIQRPRMEAETA